MTIMSFGFKYGVPADCDLVFDVRFLPNPYYVPELKHKTGRTAGSSGFRIEFTGFHGILSKLIDMIKFLIPNYIDEGKNQLGNRNRVHRRSSQVGDGGKGTAPAAGQGGCKLRHSDYPQGYIKIGILTIYIL